MPRTESTGFVEFIVVLPILLFPYWDCILDFGTNYSL